MELLKDIQVILKIISAKVNLLGLKEFHYLKIKFYQKVNFNLIALIMKTLFLQKLKNNSNLDQFSS